MARREGEITPARAAKLLGVHRDTIYRWVIAALDNRRGRLDRDDVRKDVTGYIWVMKSKVDTILAEAES